MLNRETHTGKGRAAARDCRPLLAGQTTMIFLVLIIIIFIGMGAFLLSLAKEVSQSEYLNLYTHSLLSAIMKTDTGLTDPSCTTVSDLLACSFLTPTHVCGQETCLARADTTVNTTLSAFGRLKEGFRYLLTVKSRGFVSLPNGGQPRILQIGDVSLLNAKTEKITANSRIQKLFGGSSYIMDIQLSLAKTA